MRRRLDVELVRRGLAPTRQQAQAEIAAHRVIVGGAPAEKAARLVSPGEPVQLTGPAPRYVSRGGYKLEAALGRFSVKVEGVDAVDAGASTGGFTDCLLQHGARSVWAVDVGHGQLDARLREDPRIVVHERTNVRFLTLADLGREGMPFPLVVADLSFISLRTVAAPLVGLAAPGADLVVLVKPQFEVGRVEASRGRGVITSPSLWREAITEACEALAGCGAAMIDVMVSPLLGTAGNVEFVAHLRVGFRREGGDAPVEAAVAGALALSRRASSSGEAG